MNFLSAGWIWLYIGGFLMLAELLAPGFVVFFFGLAAATVGLFMFFLPESFHLGLAWQLALFSFFSILYLVTLRRYVKSVFLGDTADAKALGGEYVGRLGRVVAAIRPEVPGRVLVGDSEWTASAAQAISEGTEVKVVSQENLTFTVVPV
jgi:hypothetical protein